jgi:hypothetical protein
MLLKPFMPLIHLKPHPWLVLLLGCVSVGLSQPAMALTPIESIPTAEEGEVPAATTQTGHWAHPSVATVTKSQVMVGYPNGQFEGKKAPTRYELAASLSALIRKLDEDMAQLKAQGQEDTEAIQALKTTQETLMHELMAVSQSHDAVGKRLQQMEVIQSGQETRLQNLEKVAVHGDFTFGTLSDFGRQGVNNSNSLENATSTVGRVRLSIDVPVKSSNPEGVIGDGNFHTRLIGAFGRYAPLNTDSSAPDYAFNLYSRVSTDYNLYNEGIQTGGNSNGAVGSSSMLRPNMYVESMFFRQKINSGVPFLTSNRLAAKGDAWKATGDAYAGVMRWWDIFDVSPYRGNEQIQFQNNALINIPGIAVNIAQPMIAWQTHQGLGEKASLDYGIALASPNVGDSLDALNLTHELRYNYNTSLFSDTFQKAGSFYVGNYYIFQAGHGKLTTNSTYAAYANRSGDSIARSNRTNSAGIYAGWNQEWGRGIGTNIGFAFNEASPSMLAFTTQTPGPAKVVGAARNGFTSVVNIPVTALNSKWRANDTIGLGYAFVGMQRDGISSDPRYRTGLEHVFEAYYKYQCGNQLAIIPSIQLIGNRLGLKGNGLTTVLGMRVSYAF